MSQRTVDQWLEIFPRLPAPIDVSPEAAIANRILGDLYGYRHTSQHRRADTEALANALIAYAKLLQDAGVTVHIGENIGSTTWVKPATTIGDIDK